MVIILFYSVLTSVPKHTFSNNLNDGESQLMFEYVIKQFFMIKISYKSMLQQNHFVIAKLKKLRILK